MYAFWQAEKVYVLDVPLYHYRIRPDSACRAYYKEQEKTEFQFKKEMSAFLKRFDLWDTFQPYVEYSLVNGAILMLSQYGTTVSGVESFEKAVKLLMRFCEEEDYKKAIQSLPFSYMMGKRNKMKLCLLKWHMYRVLMLLQMILK